MAGPSASPCPYCAAPAYVKCAPDCANARLRWRSFEDAAEEGRAFPSPKRPHSPALCMLVRAAAIREGKA